MKKLVFTSKVCEQLARELVIEEAEALKHETLVKAYKAAIVEGKMQVIRNLVEGKVFCILGKKMTVVAVNAVKQESIISVSVTMTTDPDDEQMHDEPTRCFHWEIDLGNATTPGFFEQSGLDVHKDGVDYMLEDLEVNC